MAARRTTPGAEPADGLDKFRRYRASKRLEGMKLWRLWLPDPHAPGFRAEAERQASLLRGAWEESEALAFIEATADWGAPAG